MLPPYDKTILLLDHLTEAYFTETAAGQ